MKIINGFFALYRGIVYTAVIIYLLLAIAPMLIGIQPFMVVSGSMEPNIHVGALAYVNKKDVDVAPNDIIAFNEGSGEQITVIHRIITDNGDGTYETKGDANNDKDFAPIQASQIVGKVVYNIPKLGYVTNYIRSTKGIILCAILIGIAFISSFVADSNDIKEEKEKNEKAEDETTNDESFENTAINDELTNNEVINKEIIDEEKIE